MDRYALVIHGGYLGAAEDATPEHDALLRKLTEQGLTALSRGARALDLVVELVAAMEDSGILDAGRGSYLNTAGFAETDASLMDGATGRAGAVAAMRRLANPIRAARLVMDETPHSLFVGPSGEQTVEELGAEVVDDPARYFQPVSPPAARADHGTVGAAVLDRAGRLAAGTSTGGSPGKLPGRVGDSPIVGASTWADRRCALSTTGHGEHFLQRGATRDIAARVEYQGVPLQEAVDHVVKTLIRGVDGADGAVVGLGADGAIVLSSNGYGVLWGAATSRDPVRTGARLAPELVG